MSEISGLLLTALGGGACSLVFLLAGSAITRDPQNTGAFLWRGYDPKKGELRRWPGGKPRKLSPRVASRRAGRLFLLLGGLMGAASLGAFVLLLVWLFL